MPHLLIVDDEPDIRELIRDIAQQHGFTVSQAGNIKETRIQIQRQQPNVVFMDMQLPDGNGIELWENWLFPMRA